MPRMPVQSVAFWLLDQARIAPSVFLLSNAVAGLSGTPPSQADLDAAAAFLEQAALATAVRASGHVTSLLATTAGRGVLATAIAAIRAVPDSAVP